MSLRKWFEQHPVKVQKTGVKKILLMLLLVPVIFSVFNVYLTTLKTYHSDFIENTDDLGEILEGDVITQTFNCHLDGLDCISIQIGTYGRINHCTLTASLYDGDALIQSWDIDCKQLSDDAYYPLKLNHVIESSSGKDYTLILESDGTEGNAVTILTNAVRGTICYQLTFIKLADRTSVPYLLRFAVCCAVFLIVWILINNVNASLMNKFLVIWVMLSMLFTVSNTPLNAPDEHHHFCRAYEVSMGYMISDYDEATNVGGRALPLVQDMNDLQKSWQSYTANRSMSLTDYSEFREFSNVALYAPVSYAPQALGIFIGRHISNNIPFIYYSGRFVNWLCITALLCIAIKLLPYGKEFLAIVALMPMNIHEASSLAPDAMVVALTAFIVAFIMHLREDKTSRLKVWHIIVLYISAIVISMYKIVYVPFILFYLLIPNEKFRSGIRSKIIHAAAVAVCVMVSSFGWLHICGKFLVHTGTNSDAQLMYVMTNPIDYYFAMFRTAITSGSELIFQMIGGSLAMLSVPTVGLFVIIYVILLAVKLNGLSFKSDEDSKGVKLVSGIVIAAVCLLTFTSLYLQWTPVYADSIRGLQGRYFIALMLPLYLLVTRDAKREGEEVFTLKAQWIVMLINTCACISLLFACLG